MYILDFTDGSDTGFCDGLPGLIEHGGAPVLFLLHGYGARAGALKAYRKIEAVMPSGVVVVGVLWPSGGILRELGSFWRALGRAKGTALRLADWIRAAGMNGVMILQGHSAGAAVLEELAKALCVTVGVTFVATAGAISRGAWLGRDGVAYWSRRDGVLRWLYGAAFGFLRRAIGEAGPSSGAIRGVDCTPYIAGHSDYVDSERWLRDLAFRVRERVNGGRGWHSHSLA